MSVYLVFDAAIPLHLLIIDGEVGDVDHVLSDLSEHIQIVTLM